MPASVVDEIKARIDVAEIVGADVSLRRSGRSFKGLCPFHGDRNPSFYVFPETGTWKCFSCGEGGDVFSFIQKRENLDFPEALKILADRAGVELPERIERSPTVRAEDDRLRDVLASAELYFRAALGGNAGVRAREYLDERGVNAASIEQFGLGYAPSGGLLRHLREAGFDLKDAGEVGVAGVREDGSQFEMFRDRLIFPIRDAAGQTIGFGGRVLGEGQPKYLNGPQTRFFDKSGSLFALDLARSRIRETAQVIVVEGYMDAIIAHQFGSTNVVATLGTALTERHFTVLGRRASEIILALDADAAGQAATIRAFRVAQEVEPDMHVPVPAPNGRLDFVPTRWSKIKVLTMPSGLDPDEMIRGDLEAWNSLVARAMPVVDFLVSRLGLRHDLASARGKSEAVDEALEVLREVIDPVEREHYLQRLAGVLGMHESSLREKLRALMRSRGYRGTRPKAEAESSRSNYASNDVPEAYALAIGFIIGPSAGGDLEPAVTSALGRAILSHLVGSSADDSAMSRLAVLVDGDDPVLASGVAQTTEWVSRLSTVPREQLQRELEVSVLKLRQQQLRLQHREVLTLLNEPADSADRPSAASILRTIAAQLKEIEAGLSARDGTGSLVWRSRQLGEVLGG